jgi:hypothetical protein
MENLCKKINCCHWSEGAKQGEITVGYGCHKYSGAMFCPVAFIKKASATEYGVYAEDGVPPLVEICARACCPDPLVRGTADI